MANDLLTFGLANRPDAPAVVEGSNSFSFRDIHLRANALVRYFLELGISSGDRVALLAKNESQFLEIQVACMRAGVILVPINFRLAEPEVSFILGDCEPKLVMVTPEFHSLVTGCPALLLDEAYESRVANGPDDPLPEIVDSRDCTILYTSGTTGRPKGAVLTNHAMFARLNANIFEYQVNPGDVFLQCLPLFHIASNVSYTYTHLGATNVFLKDFHPLAVLDLIEQHRVTTALLVPTMINAVIHQPEVAKANLTSLDKIAYGASPIPPTVLAEAIETLGCNFLQLYGMTETSAATVLRPEHHDPASRPHLLASAGQVALGMETRIVDEEDQEQPAGEAGEIVCRGAAVMRGYWNRDDASAEALKNGWMHTGDIGYKDEAGFFYVTDRKKDMIVSGGENVYPREVEDVLYEHPDVLEAAVIGIPDEKWGERVHAILVTEKGRTPDLADILIFARERLAAYKVPKSGEFMNDLPKNATGKILKPELRKPYWGSEERGIA